MQRLLLRDNEDLSIMLDEVVQGIETGLVIESVRGQIKVVENLTYQTFAISRQKVVLYISGEVASARFRLRVINKLVIYRISLNQIHKGTQVDVGINIRSLCDRDAFDSSEFFTLGGALLLVTGIITKLQYK